MKTKPSKSLRSHLHEIIYEADTPAGKLFDIVLLFLILFSVAVAILESITAIRLKYTALLGQVEWVITIIFSLEYLARIIVVKKPWKYVTSFFGIIDLMSLLPKYISLIMVGSSSLVALRALRLLRVFRILKLSRYIGESNFLLASLRASRAKIGVFLFAVLILCIIFGTIMYLIEGEEHGFTSIPRGIYWCIVTLTTVGYGDIAPVTSLGRFIASIIMIMGYGIIAVPTGIVTSEMNKQYKNPDTNTQACPNCMTSTHLDNAIYCHNCGNTLNEEF
ncbi:MAG: ion transporter [Flavobacteriaceae bacterium]